MKRLIPFFLVLLVLAGTVWAADTLTLTSQDNIEFVEEHSESFAKLARLAGVARRRQAQADKASADALAWGALLRRGIVRRKPAADAVLPATLWDAAIDPNDVSGGTAIYWNAEAEVFRNPPPP